MPPILQFWELNGNTNTNPDKHFIGTTDDRPLVIKAGNGVVDIGKPDSTCELDVHNLLLLKNTKDQETIRLDGSDRSLGTVDAHPLVIKTHGQERLRIDENGNIGVGTDKPLETLDVHGRVRMAAPNLPVANTLKVLGHVKVEDIPPVPHDPNHVPPLPGVAAVPAQLVVHGSKPRVGIGTEAPEKTLDVVGQVRLAQIGGLVGLSIPETLAVLGRVKIADVPGKPGPFGYPPWPGQLEISGTDPRLMLISATNETWAVHGDSRLEFVHRAPGGTDSTLMALSNDGNVGIGTATPAQALHVSGSVRVEGHDHNWLELSTVENTKRVHVQFNADDLSFGPYPGSAHMMTLHRDTGIELDSSVGIRTADPQASLHVNGSLRVGYYEHAWLELTAYKDTTTSTGDCYGRVKFHANQLSFQYEGGGDILKLWYDGRIEAKGSVDIGTAVAPAGLHVSGGAIVYGLTLGADAAGIDYVCEYESVGVSDPTYNLRLQSPNAIFFHTGPDATARGIERVKINAVGADGKVTAVAIGHCDAPAEVLVEGKLTVTNDILVSGADCAEEFEISAGCHVEPGMVMVFDDEGELRPATQTYDRRVAGVISGAGDLKPGLRLGSQPDGTGHMPLALAGRAYCRVDAGYGAIEAGDLLTTSPTPGHAMKATDATKAFGAVLGKALHPLGQGQGLIPILIALQ